MHRGRKLSPGEPASEESKFSWSIFFLLLSSRGQVRVRFVKLLAVLTPPSYHPLPQGFSHLGRVSPSFPLAPTCCIPQPASWADLVRTDTLKAQDGHSLENVGQDRRAKSDRRCRTSQEVQGTRYHSRIRLGRAGLRRLGVLVAIRRGLRRWGVWAIDGRSQGWISGAGHNTWARASGKN